MTRAGAYGGRREPNNWESVLGGSAWEWNEPTGEYYLHMFTLELPALKSILNRWQEGLAERGWNSLYWCNHDQPRPVSRFGDPARRVESATMLATCLHLMRGTPFIYQGEELGMTNVPFASIADCRDVESLNFHRLATAERGWSDAQTMASIRAKGRDNARVPMPWDAGPNGGFGAAPPWLGVHPDYREVNAAAAVADSGSVFHHYRRLIALRREHAILTGGRYVPLIPDHSRLFAYLRVLED